MDFSNCKLSGLYYSGSEKKLGIIIDSSNYMLKFQKFTDFGPCYNHISEYIGSQIFELLGFDVQKTFLGTYNGEQVVACKDFLEENEQFVPFNDVGESSLEQDKDKYQYSYEDIMLMLNENKKLTNVKETVEVFWQMFIVDAWLGNFDRHGANWGFIKQNNKYRIAPVFDNGSCLFPKMNDEATMMEVINSEEETNKRIFGFPTSQIKLHGKKSSYYDVISCREFKECNDALKIITSRIRLDDVFDIINSCDITETHKNFYIHMLNARYEIILRSNLK